MVEYTTNKKFDAIKILRIKMDNFYEQKRF